MQITKKLLFFTQQLKLWVIVISVLFLIMDKRRKLPGKASVVYIYTGALVTDKAACPLIAIACLRCDYSSERTFNPDYFIH